MQTDKHFPVLLKILFKKKSQKEMHFLKKIIYIYYKVQYFQAQKLSQKHFENGVGLLYKGMD